MRNNSIYRISFYPPYFGLRPYRLFRQPLITRLNIFYYDKMKDAVILIFFRRFVADFQRLISVCNVPAILKVYD